MKNWKSVFLAAAIFPASAFAQSVTLYGVIDSGVEYVSNVGASKDGLFRVPSNTGTTPSRWGMRGTEDLGGGLKSVFVLESGFAPDAGNSGQGGRLFGRQALVGLSGPWGQVAFGRQYSMIFWGTLDTDTLGANIYGSGALDPYLSNPRVDNAISYKGTFGGLTVGGTYSFGRDSAVAPGSTSAGCAGENASDTRACQQWSALLLYEQKSWGISAAYDVMRGGTGAPNGLTGSSISDKRLALGGYALLGNAKLGAGVILRNNGGSATRRSNLWYTGAAYDITPAITLSGQVYYLDYRNSDNHAFLYTLRGAYNFSKRTSVYATIGHINNSGQLAQSVSVGAPGSNPAPGGSQFGTMIGIRHIF